MTHNKRMETLGLTSLEDRRIRDDMIDTYKIMTGKEDISRDKIFKLAPMRGDINEVRNLRIFKKQFNQNKRKYFFSQRVIGKWNQLSNEEVNAAKTSGFKANYDRKEAERRAARCKHPYVSGIRNYILRVFTSVYP